MKEIDGQKHIRIRKEDFDMWTRDPQTDEEFRQHAVSQVFKILYDQRNGTDKDMPLSKTRDPMIHWAEAATESWYNRIGEAGACSRIHNC